MPFEPGTGRPAKFVAVNALLCVLATSFVAARFISKHLKRLRWTVDDVLILFALCLCYACTAEAIATVTVGVFGPRMLSATPDEIERTLLLVWTLQFPYAAAMVLTQVSLSILCIRTFFTRILFARLRYAAYGCIVFYGLWFFTLVIVNLSHCRPLKYNWTLPLENPKRCFSLKPYFIFMVASGLVFDCVIWSLPHFVVWKLQMRLAHKIAITSIFALGFFNILTGTFRLVSLMNLRFDQTPAYDPLPAILWTVVQVSVAIVLACCPLLRPLFETCIPRSLTRMRSNSKASTRLSTIRVTTRVEVFDDSRTPRVREPFDDGLHDDQRSDRDAPTFEVGRESDEATTLASTTV